MQFEIYVVYSVLVILGLCFGSFAGASVWRLRARQLQEDKQAGEPVARDEYDKLKKISNHKLSSDRSMCLHCGYTLEWYDLIPLFSWLLLRGRCRKCRGKIGYFEPLSELGLALFFVFSYMFWPYPLTSGLDVARLVIWLMSGVGLAILFAYDLKWSLLPDKVNYMVIGLGLISSAVVIVGSSDKFASFASIVGAVAILSGLYWAIYILSSGKWIGFGDIKLGLGLGLLLADWRLAFIALFAANLVGSLIVLPPMLLGKLKRDSHVPFGPLLIIGFTIAGLSGGYLLSLFFYTLV